MTPQTTVDSGLLQLNEILVRDLGVTGENPMERIGNAAAILPDELAAPLTRILKLYPPEAPTNSLTDHCSSGEFWFECGVAHERLRAFVLARMEVESAIMGSGSVSTSPLHNSESDQISRFISARDRLFRKVADATLKFLLIGLGLLTIGLLLGII